MLCCSTLKVAAASQTDQERQLTHRAGLARDLGSEERQDGTGKNQNEREFTECEGSTLKGLREELRRPGPATSRELVRFGELHAVWIAVEPEPNVTIFFIIGVLGVEAESAMQSVRSAAQKHGPASGTTI